MTLLALEKCVQNNIHATAINSHFSHIGAPNNNGINQAIEKTFNKVRFRNNSSLCRDGPLPLYEFNAIFTAAYKQLTSNGGAKTVIKNGFKKTGIHPLDENAVLQNPEFIKISETRELFESSKKRLHNTAANIPEEINTIRFSPAKEN